MHTSSWCWKGIAFENPTSWELCTCTELSGSKRDRTVVSIRAFPVFPCVSHLGNMKSGSRFSWRAVKSLVFCKASHSAAVSKSLAERTDRSDRINLPTCLCKVQPGSTGSTRINQDQPGPEQLRSRTASRATSARSSFSRSSALFNLDLGFLWQLPGLWQKNLTRKTFIFSMILMDSFQRNFTDI